MKLSTSSSVFLATLALSSSTSTLAAPARDAQGSGLTTSSSFRDMLAPTVQEASHCSAHRPQPTAARPGSLVARSDVPSDVLELISGLPKNLLEVLQALLGVTSASAPISLENLVAALLALQQTTTGHLNPGVVGKTPVVQAEVQSSATSSSVAGIFASTTPTPSVAVNDISPSSSASASSSATPSSPHLPANPPNTPTLPAHIPSNQ